MADEEKKVSLVLDGKVEGLLSAMMQGQKAVESGVGAMTQQFGMLTGTLGKIPGIMGIVTAALAGGGMKDAIDTTKEVVGEVNKLSRTLGITAEQASVLRVAIDDAFLTVEDVTGGVNRLTKQLLTNEDAIKKLGVQTRDSNGNYRESLDIMLEVNSALSKIKAGTDQNVAGMSVYGRGWGEARNLMRLTSEAVDDARARAERLHLIFGSEGQQQVREYRSAMKDLDDVAESMKVTIGRELIPALTSLSVAFGEAGASVADGFSSSLRESMRMMAEHSLALNTFFKKASAIMNGGPLGTNWLTKSGRAEIGAELDAIEQLQQYGMERIAGRYGSYVKPASAPSTKDRLPGDFNDKNSGPSKTNKQYQDYIDWRKAWAEQQDMGPFTVEMLNARGEMSYDQQQSLNQRQWAQRNAGTDMMEYQDQFDRAAFENEQIASSQRMLERETEFNAMRAQMNGDNTAMEMLRIQQEEEAWMQSWAMQTSSFEEFERRKLLIEEMSAEKRKQLAQTEWTQRMQYGMQGISAMGNLFTSLNTLTKNKSKELQIVMKGIQIGEAIANTALGVTKALAQVPWPLDTVVAGAIAAAGAAQIAVIASSDSGGVGSSSNYPSYNSNPGTYAPVTQPVSAAQTAGPQVTIVVQGNVIGHDEWVENNLAPTIRELVGRNVSFGLQPV